MLNNITVTSDDVFNTIMKLKDDKAPSNDGFTTEFLKKLASDISELLAIIYKNSSGNEIANVLVKDDIAHT